MINQRRKRSERKPLITLCACLVAVASCTRTETVIRASGSIEATAVRISSKSSGEILKVFASEGLAVKPGDALAQIDHGSLDLQLAQARAGAAYARAELALLNKGAREEDIAQAEERVKEAQEILRNADEDFARMEELFKNGSATRKQRDDAEARLAVARSQSNSAEQSLKKVSNAVRPEEVRAAEAKVDQAEYAVRIIQKMIDDCTVRCAVRGIVTSRLVEEGELALPGTPLLVVSVLDAVDLVIYVPEPSLGRITIGEPAKITIDAFPDRSFQGTVVYISPEAEFTPKNVQTQDERATLVYGVKIRIANPEGIFKPGMPADAVLDEAPAAEVGGRAGAGHE
jgi:HlyD family secretion protein